MNIGLIGTGRMGAAMGQRLLDCGHQLYVWNRSVEKTEALRERGAHVMSCPAEVVAQSEIVVSILTDANALEAAFGGDAGALHPPLQGKLFIEMSTVRPETQVFWDAEIKKRGGSKIDCPVGGTVGPARDGKLLGLVGGAEADVTRARVVLDQLCRRVEHVGQAGAGASLKLAINLPLLVYWQAVSEAISLAAPLNLEPSRLLDIIGDTSGAPAILKFRGGAIAAALAGKQEEGAHFNLDSIRKDMRTMIEEAQAHGWVLPVTQTALQCFDKASAQGLGDKDGTQLPAWWVRDVCKT